MTSGWTEVSASTRATTDGSWSIASTLGGLAWTSTLVWNVAVRTFHFQQQEEGEGSQAGGHL